MKTKILSILALLLSLIVGEVQAQKSLPSKQGFEQNRKSANARETFGQNRKSANAREVQSATTAQTPSRRSVLRAPSTDVLAPTDVTASGITPASATVSWNGTGDSYNLRYRKMYLSEGFESCSHGELPAGWTALDADGDGHSWFAFDFSEKLYDKEGHPNSFDKKCVMSESYDYETGALTPDNWLISPQVPLKGKLSLWAKGVDPEWAAEHFAIYLSTTGKDVADFTTVLIPETAAQGVLTEYTADLSAYAGQVGYIAIRHFHVTDMFELAVDNITITDNWVEADGVTSPYTLDGLEELSSYEVEVQAVKGEQQSSWSTLRFNTLPSNATITYDLTLADGTEDASNWQGKAGEGEYQQLPLEGVAAGTAVTVKYDGTKKVKSVKAKKKAAAPAGPTLDLATVTEATTVEDGYTVTGTLGANVLISIADGATVTLDGVTINGANSFEYEWAGITCLGDATIILSGTNTVKGFQNDYSGIYVPQDKTLTIEGSGSLTASSNGCACGIGGGYGNACGNIVIAGGTITATGGMNAAGIGSGNGSGCGDISITGGTIIASGGDGAGIGGGFDGSCGNISITGGTITANGGNQSAGIGGGSWGSCGTITITNGVTSVTATKGNNTPYSIGAGLEGSCGTVTIGGVVGAITDSPYTYEP